MPHIWAGVSASFAADGAAPVEEDGDVEGSED